jgi:aminopeptidase-like protein
LIHISRRRSFIKNGIYLDFLGNHDPLGFQHSFQTDSLMDKITGNVLRSHIPSSVEADYRNLAGNDEMFYNGPGFEIPTIGISRMTPREYHYDTDNMDNLNIYHLRESFWALRRIIEVFETDFVPVRKYQGPLYLSRYDMYINPVTDQSGNHKLEALQIYMDGRNSCFDIADKLGLDYFATKALLDELAKNDLIEKNHLERDNHEI